jgi:hypothetical protein
MDQLTLRRATEADVEEVLAILDEAACWLASIGVQQCPSPFPRPVVERDLEHNAVWLASHGAHPVATASVLTRDQTFWGDVGGSAWYLHRLAIRRDVAGSGRSVLELIECEEARSGMRLDCGVGLRSYYQDAGYRLRSWLSHLNASSSPPRSKWFCYEKKLAAMPS